jgi:uncharacterized zinc-type alcohol dehydrogenase-like protein
MENNYGMPATREDEYKDIAWGLPAKGGKFAPMWINRPNPGENDIKMEVLYCGICHSDSFMGEDPMGIMQWPFIPGHEFIGRVVEVGSAVTMHKIGSVVGVGCYVDKCDTCTACVDEEESYCRGKVLTIQGKKTGKRISGNPDRNTEGGYAATHVINEKFAFNIPDTLDLTKAAPILCGGITVFSPLKHWGALDGKKMTIGVIGIGGLGTMAIKLAKAMGHDVLAVSSTAAKEQLAMDKGATFFCASTDPESIKANAGKCNLIINTVSANHDVNTYLPLLARDGTVVILGIAFAPHPIMGYTLMQGRYSISGSSIGSIKDH